MKSKKKKANYEEETFALTERLISAHITIESSKRIITIILITSVIFLCVDTHGIEAQSPLQDYAWNPRITELAIDLMTPRAQTTFIAEGESSVVRWTCKSLALLML